MDAKLEVLKKFYDELGVTSTVDTIEQRLVLQKTVFLGECFDVPLGYTYNWYVKGPYSPSLTEDYYELQTYKDEPVNIEFKPEIKVKLTRLKDILDSEYQDERSHWFEALASIAFLIKKSNKSKEAALEVMASAKPHINANMSARALEVLENKHII